MAGDVDERRPVGNQPQIEPVPVLLQQLRANVDPDIRFGLDFELFTEGVKEAVIGAPSGVGVMVVVEEATAVVAAPLILPAAVAPTLAAAATTAASAVTVVGLAATAKMGFEVARG